MFMVLYLSRMIEPCVSDPVVINLELVHSPYIGDLEHCFIYTIGFLLQSLADERIDAHKL